MKKGAASGRAGGMDERKAPWSEEYPELNGRQLNAPRGVAEELGDLLEHRIGNWEIELAYSLWGINAPGRIKLTSGTWLSPAHISLAALKRPVWLPLWRPLSLPYPRYTPTPSYACWARCIAISSSVDAPEWNMIRDGKRKTFFSGGLSLVKPKTPQDKVQLLGRGHDQ